jgi:hypothetical protein
MNTPREITKGVKIYTYCGKIEGHTIYKDGMGHYFTYKNGKLRVSRRIAHIVSYGW